MLAAESLRLAKRLLLSLLTCHILLGVNTSNDYSMIGMAVNP
jgi:hypothetical protein